MKNTEARVLILIGHYGTGKTTLALNQAIKWSKEDRGIVSLIDLDANNPYFRSRDWALQFKDYSIDWVIPDQEVAYGELPYLPRHLYSAIQDDSRRVIIDVGGHEVGTTVLGSIAEKMKNIPYELWMVVNIYRPDMETKEEIKVLFHQLQRLAQLKITGLINNTHLAELTEIDDLIRGEEIVSSAAIELEVPFIGSAVEDGFILQAEQQMKYDVIPIKRFKLLF